MKKIEITVGTTYKGLSVNPGDVLEVDDTDFFIFTSQKQAKPYLPVVVAGGETKRVEVEPKTKPSEKSEKSAKGK